jgi:hypothetical protein
MPFASSLLWLSTRWLTSLLGDLLRAKFEKVCSQGGGDGGEEGEEQDKPHAGAKVFATCDVRKREPV